MNALIRMTVRCCCLFLQLVPLLGFCFCCYYCVSFCVFTSGFVMLSSLSHLVEDRTFLTNGISHNATYNKVRMVNCIY